MALPSDFPELIIAEQLFVAVDRQRVDRAGTVHRADASPDSGAAEGADAAGLRQRPGPAYSSVTTERIV